MRPLLTNNMLSCNQPRTCLEYDEKTAHMIKSISLWVWNDCL